MTVLAVCASAMLCGGCYGPRVIPDQTIPHRIAKPATLVLWHRLPDGSQAEQSIAVPAGWWVASPYCVEDLK